MKKVINRLTVMVLTLTVFTTCFFAINLEEASAVSRILGQPKITKASVVNNNTVKLQWGKTKNAVKYKVFRKKADGKFVLVKTTTKRSYQSGKLAYGTKYTYKVQAVSKTGKKKMSKAKVAYTTPEKPVIIVSMQSANKAKISWKKVNGAVKYKVYRKKADGKFILVKTTTKRIYESKNLAYNTQYTYKVKAISKDGKTNTSAVKKVTTGKKAVLTTVPMQNLPNSEYSKDHEQINGYNAWVSTDRSENFDVIKSTLYLYNGQATAAIYAVYDGRIIDDIIITDGQKLYFAVVHQEFVNNYTGFECNATVFMYDLLSGKCTVLAEIDKMNGLAGVGDNMLYINQSVFHAAGSGTKTSLCSYNLETEEVVTIKENFIAESQFGDYILGTGNRHDANVTYTVVNLETLEMSELPRAWRIAAVEDGVLYYPDGSNAIEKCDYDGNRIESFQINDIMEVLYLGRNTVGYRTKDGETKTYSFMSEENMNIVSNENVSVVGSWTNPSSVSMADMVDLKFQEDMTVTCYLQRQEYYGTYTVEGNQISAIFTEGKAYSNMDASWHDVKDVQLKIEGQFTGNALNVTILEHENYSWKASMVRK